MRKDRRICVAVAWKALCVRLVGSTWRGAAQGAGRRLVESAICICKLFFIRHPRVDPPLECFQQTLVQLKTSVESRLWINFSFPPCLSLFLSFALAPPPPLALRVLIGSRYETRSKEKKEMYIFCTDILFSLFGCR